MNGMLNLSRSEGIWIFCSLASIGIFLGSICGLYMNHSVRFETSPLCVTLCRRLNQRPTDVSGRHNMSTRSTPMISFFFHSPLPLSLPFTHSSPSPNLPFPPPAEVWLQLTWKNELPSWNCLLVRTFVCQRTKGAVKNHRLSLQMLSSYSCRVKDEVDCSLRHFAQSSVQHWPHWV